jgi:glycosyltransferase involved in cell wall biosynthesis
MLWMKKLAIITSHPIQYNAPWFCHLAGQSRWGIKVFYLWDFGVSDHIDVGFQREIRWDIPLLNGYEYEFVPNVSSSPGTHHFWGLRNPLLLARVGAYDPDAVLLMGYNYASFYRFLYGWGRARAPLLFRGDSHRIIRQSGGKEWARRKVISSIFRRFSAFLYVGGATRDYFRYHGVPRRKLFFAPHAVDNERFFRQGEQAARDAAAWKRELGIPDDNAIILMAGKLETKKRPLDLLFAFLAARLERVTLLFVGSGHLEGELRNRANGHAHIRFASFQNQSLMPRTYAAADLVILPSYGTQETWGLAINEAMCMSRPVIVSDHVGCAQDLVKPFRNGLIFPAADVPALTAALREAFSDRARLQAWGDEGHRIVEGYSYRQTTQGLEEALEQFSANPAYSKSAR